MASISDSSFHIPVSDLKVVLRGADLAKEAEGMTPEVTDLGNGVVVEKRGSFHKMVGEAQMSLRAKMAAYDAARIGGKAGQAIFETYRKTHTEEFGAAAVAKDKAMMEGRFEPPAAPSSTQESAPSGRKITVKNGGTFEADGDTAVNVDGGRNVTVTGSAEDDFLAVLYGSTAYGLAGRDRIHGQDRATLDGGDGDDILTAYKDSTLYGGAGNDVLDAHDRAVLDGGDGDDQLSGYDAATLTGGAGNDRMSGYYNVLADGGAGDDLLSAYDNAQVTDLSGDNDIHVYAQSVVTTGSGNDRIQASDRSVVDAGDGYNLISAGNFSTVTAGSGDDLVGAGDRSMVKTGAGDDVVQVGRGSDVTTGTGDDRLIVGGETTIHFNRGDGNDSIGGSEWGQAYRATDRLSSSVLSFGAGIVPADLTMRRQGNDLLVQIGSDSVTLKDVQRHGIPTMSFADGSVLPGDQIEAMVGPAEAYQPVSQVMQRFCDASAAYTNQLNTTGTRV